MDRLFNFVFVAVLFCPPLIGCGDGESAAPAVSPDAGSAIETGSLPAAPMPAAPAPVKTLTEGLTLPDDVSVSGSDAAGDESSAADSGEPKGMQLPDELSP